MNDMSYRIVRQYFNSHRKNDIIKVGLTLEEAQAHCQDPETSSSTCTSAASKAITEEYGEWFDSYTDGKPRRSTPLNDLAELIYLQRSGR